MKTFIEVIKWAGCALAILGFAFAAGMLVSEGLYRKALGYDAYYALNVLSLSDILGIFIMGFALAAIAVILEAVFQSGERSAAQEEQKDD